MAKKSGQGGILWALLCFFLGWFGVDKILKGRLMVGLCKFLLNFLIIGEIWNIADIIMSLFNKYQIDPRNYLK